MSDLIRPRRSALYMPGSNERALEKAKSLDVDAVIIDLEDSVAPDAKVTARETACAAVKSGGYGRREVLVRINGLASDQCADDVAAVAASGADAICFPKVEHAGALSALRGIMKKAAAPTGTSIWAMIETPLAIMNLTEIAAACPDDNYPVAVLLLGTNDLIKDSRALDTPDRWPVLPALSICVMAARAHGIDILDGVYNDFRDDDGLRRECEQGRALGMDGKTLIHPNQVAIANDVFSPPADEVAEARAIIAAFEQPENRGKGVINMNGKMVELLHRDIARRTVAIADAIAAGHKT